MSLREPDYEIIAKIRAEELDAKALEIATLRAQLERAEADTRRLREALKPFWDIVKDPRTNEGGLRIGRLFYDDSVFKAASAYEETEPDIAQSKEPA